MWAGMACFFFSGCVCMTHTVTHVEGLGFASHMSRREWVMDVCVAEREREGRERDKCGHIPPLTWDSGNSPSDYTAGVETLKLPHVPLRVWSVWRPERFLHNHLMHFLCHRYDHKFLKKMSLLTQKRRVMTEMMNHMTSVTDSFTSWPWCEG